MELNYRKIGSFITKVSEKNKDGLYDEVLGVAIEKEFMPSVANTIGTDLKKYNVVRKNRFAFNPMHVGRDEKLPIAVYHKEEPALISPAYFMFEVSDKAVDVDYLMLIFKTPSFDHLCWYHTDASVRGGLTWEDFIDIDVIIPSLEEQARIVKQYKTTSERIEALEKLNAELEDIASIVIRNMYSDNECNHKIADYCEDMIGGDWGKEEEVGNYKSFVTCIRGADIPYFNQGIITTAPNRYIISKNLISRKIEPGNLIIEMSGGTVTQATGRVACASEDNLHGLDVICSNFCRLLKIKEGYEYIIFEIWKKLYREDVMFSYENGTSGLKNFEIDNFINEVDIYISDNAAEINQQLKDIYTTVHRNGLEIEVLSKLKRQVISKL